MCLFRQIYWYSYGSRVNNLYVHTNISFYFAFGVLCCCDTKFKLDKVDMCHSQTQFVRKEYISILQLYVAIYFCYSYCRSNLLGIVIEYNRFYAINLKRYCKKSCQVLYPYSLNQIAIKGNKTTPEEVIHRLNVENNNDLNEM